MMKFTLLALSLFITVFFAGCDLTDSKSTPAEDYPYFEYTVGDKSLVRVNCSEIRFEAESGDGLKGIMASSRSTKSTFTFAFPEKASEMDKISPGSFPLKEYIGYTYDDIPLHLSVKAPETQGGVDYFFSVEPYASEHNHTIIKITKGKVEDGKQVYWVNGTYTAPATNSSNQEAIIKGSYLFKLLLVL